eukprot:TRINITY_DN7874_c0_g1_i2.p1 TRINITY_DN7874_c0_g1~~TRINITY_DN7874_c0_g1_i2.p1  ORF type:complete len:166 (-),score=33.61 TRINITY_DN7874_c0_g1_i2:460-957(-)
MDNRDCFVRHDHCIYFRIRVDAAFSSLQEWICVPWHASTAMEDFLKNVACTITKSSTQVIHPSQVSIVLRTQTTEIQLSPEDDLTKRIIGSSPKQYRIEAKVKSGSLGESSKSSIIQASHRLLGDVASQSKVHNTLSKSQTSQAQLQDLSKSIDTSMLREDNVNP